MLSRLALSALVALTLSTSPALLTSAEDPPPPDLKTALKYLELGQADKALEILENLHEDQADPSLLAWQAVAHNQLGDPNKAEKVARQALAASDDPEVTAPAWNAIGLALTHDPKKTKDVEAGVEAFQKALAVSNGVYHTALLNLGRAQLQLEQDDEGRKTLRRYLDHDPPESLAQLAQGLIDDPRRARESIIPAFSVTTLDGRKLTDADLRGKVVLYDFWATWCVPCIQALPEMERHAERMAEDPFVLVSISTDQDRKTLEKFLAERGEGEMAWPQIWDERHALARSFGVRNYPTYILADPEGRVIYTSKGWGDTLARALGAEVRSAIKKAKKSGK